MAAHKSTRRGAALPENEVTGNVPVLSSCMLLGLKLFLSGTAPFGKQHYKLQVGLDQKMGCQNPQMFLEISGSCPRFAAVLYFAVSQD